MKKKFYDILFNFIKPLILKRKKTSKILLIADRGNIDVAIRVSMFAKIINEKKNLNVVVISDFKNHISHEIYKKNNILKLIKFSEFFNKKKFNPIIIIKFLGIYFKFIYNFIFNKNYMEEFIKEYSINDIKVGDVLYDFYIRKNLNFLNLEGFSLHFLIVSFKNIFLVLLRLEFLKYIFKKYDVSLSLSSAKGYIALGNLLLRYSSKNKKKVVLFSGQFMKRYNKHTECFRTALRFTEKNIKKFDKIFKKKVINEYYTKKFIKLKLNYNNHGPYIVHKTFESAYKKKQKLDKKFQKNILKKKICVLALNCFSDAPHYQGPLLFRDFYDHFVQTVNFIISTEPHDQIWLIKPHPAIKLYDEGGLIEKYIFKANKKYLQMSPKNVNNLELFKHTDYLITAISSIALEYACYGKRPIICSENAYTGYGFTMEPTSIKNYFATIKTLNFQNKLTQIEKLRARRIYYYLDNFANNNLEKSNLLPIRKNFSDEVYIKKLLINQNNYSNNNLIIKDNYYKSLDSRIKELKI